MLETEIKFAVHPSFLVPATLEIDGELRELPAQTLHSTYYDSPELRLARNGITLRHRIGEEVSPTGTPLPERRDPQGTGRVPDGPVWTLKLPVSVGTALARNELNFDADHDDIPEAARDLVTAYVRNSYLAAVGTLVTARKRWVVCDPNETEIAVISDDEVSLLDGDRVLARFREVELEARESSEDRLDEIAKPLRAAGAMPAEPIPKVVRALGPKATFPPDVATPAPVKGSDPSGALVKAAIARATNRLMAHDAPARLGDAEGVHQMRVACRRIRSDLKTFAPLVDESWSGRLTDELRWLGRVLGDVRDVDVMTVRFLAAGRGLETSLNPLFRLLQERREAANARMLEALRSRRYLDLLDELVGAANEPRLTEAAELPAAGVLSPLVQKPWKKLIRAAKRADGSQESLHATRIRAKKVRYATEAVTETVADPKEAKRFARRAEDLQDVLGEHQDAHVAVQTIEEIAMSNKEDGDLNRAAGRLMERELSAAARARDSWRAAWKKLSDKKSPRWLKN